MANNDEKITKTEMITVYLFLAMMAAIVILSGWVIYSSWNWELF